MSITATVVPQVIGVATLKLLCIASLTLALLTPAIGEEVHRGQLAGSEDGKTCPTLPVPENGEYTCAESKAEYSITCTLECEDGYMTPVIQHHWGKHLPLDQRGVYKCINLPGGYVWEPNIFFDCIEKKTPSNFVFFFPVAMAPSPPCSTENDSAVVVRQVSKQLSHASVHEECQKLKQPCHWNIKTACRNGQWLMDAFLNLPFTSEGRENYQDWKKSVIRSVISDTNLGHVFTLDNVSKASIGTPMFYLLCPRGSRLEQDFTCRGCSRGYFMDESVLECKPCPVGQYQSQAFQTRCQVCPVANYRPEVALRSRVDCFHAGRWAKKTSMLTVLAALTSIVVLASILFTFRSQVRNEPDGISREYYKPEPIPRIGGTLQLWARWFHEQTTATGFTSKSLSSIDNVTKRLSGAGEVPVENVDIQEDDYLTEQEESLEEAILQLEADVQDGSLLSQEGFVRPKREVTFLMEEEKDAKGKGTRESKVTRERHSFSVKAGFALQHAAAVKAILDDKGEIPYADSRKSMSMSHRSSIRKS